MTVDAVFEKYNIAVPFGTHPLTGVGGSTLAGGSGFLARQYGLTCDNLIECEVVLTNGDIVTANDINEYADLMQGLRGGGGNFGIVTKFIYKTHVIKDICGGFLTYWTPTVASALEVCMNFDTALQVNSTRLTHGRNIIRSHQVIQLYLYQ